MGVQDQRNGGLSVAAGNGTLLERVSDLEVWFGRVLPGEGSDAAALETDLTGNKHCEIKSARVKNEKQVSHHLPTSGVSLTGSAEWRDEAGQVFTSSP